MGLLDSPFVGQLVKKDTITATASSSQYIGTVLDITRYNLVGFKITVTSGSLDGTNSYISLYGSVGSGNYSPADVYKRKSDNTFADKTKVCVAGEYATEDLSALNKCQFYLTTTSAVTVTIEYVASFMSFQDKLNNIVLNSINTSAINLSNDVLRPREELIQTWTNIDASTTGNKELSLLDVNKYYDALRITIEFNQTDDNAVFLVLHRKGGTGGWQEDIIIGEDGVYRNKIIADTTKFDYYKAGLSPNINIRCSTAGASGLTATIKVYAITSNNIPTVRHIQPVYTKKISTNTETITIPFNTLMQMYKFFFCYVGSSPELKTGTITKNYPTSEEDDSDTLMSFTSKAVATTKWLPVTAIDGASITFTVSGARITGADKVIIYGVV